MAADLPRLELGDAEDELGALLREGQLLILQHPVAAQAACRALVAEGRRYAVTPEGQALRARLVRSGLARRLREAWELGTLNALDPDATTPVPSDLVDLLFAAAQSGRPLLDGLWRSP